MLNPSVYEQVTTLSDPSQAGNGQLNGHGSAALVAVNDVADLAPGANRRRGVHPLHWLVDGHWLGRWRTPLLLRLWRYGAGSFATFIISSFAFWVLFSWAHVGATTSAVLAFLAGFVPSVFLNRRWAWQQRGRQGAGRQTSMYVLVSGTSLVVQAAVTKLAALEAHRTAHLEKDLLVTASFMFTTVGLFGLKYLAYDRLVFSRRSGARRSRHQVPTTTEPNRQP